MATLPELDRLANELEEVGRLADLLLVLARDHTVTSTSLSPSLARTQSMLARTARSSSSIESKRLDARSTDAPTDPLTNAPPTEPAVTGVLLILDEEMSDLLTYGEFDTVVQTMTDPVNTAANACGTSLAGMISAGGGLVVRLEDPSLNACLITELAGAEHIVSAEEDMRMTVQG